MNEEKEIVDNVDDIDMSDENDLLQTAVYYMDTFLNEVNNIVSEFRGSNYSRLTDMNKLFEGFQWIYLAVYGIKNEYNAEIEIDDKRYKEALEAAEEALRNSDVVLLTDVLEYEIIELVQGWYGER